MSTETHRVQRVFVSPKEAAETTTLSEKTIRRLIWRGELDAVKVGQRVLIPVEALRTLGVPV